MAEAKKVDQTAVRRPYVSQSQLTMYEKCGEMYRRRYIEKHIIPPGVAMLKGTGLHKGSQFNFSQKIESKIDLPKKQIIEVSISEYEAEIKKSSVSLTSEEESRGLKTVVAEAKDSLAQVAGLYADEMAPEYQPEFVEKEILLTIPGSSHDLLAYIDLADIRKILVDLKFTAKKKTQIQVDTDEQLSFYALVYFHFTKTLPAGVRFENFVDRVSEKTAKRVTERHCLSSTRDYNDLQSTTKRINAMLEGLKKGVFIPANRMSWWCGERWCGYAKTCPFFTKSKNSEEV